jgi:tRNA modification GTPase
MKRINDTIAAVATPPGEGGIAVIRISGSDAIAIADRCFSGGAALRDCATHTAHFGEILNPGGEVVDQVVCTLFRAPHSYTGEETVEVSCHGGSLVTRRVLETIVGAGARYATPGEFTQRAFLNGRMDLSQAEAVADLIHAHSDVAHRASLEQLRGSVLRSIDILRQQLLDSSSMIELELDFSEEHYEFKDRAELGRQLKATITRVRELASTFQHGRIVREGVRTVIAGAPNVGKSSLLNALLNENRAIVTAIPGTTRDFIEESVNIQGIEFRLIDTAGIHEATDEVEREGVERSKSLIERADIVLYLLDHSRPIFPMEIDWVMRIHKTRREGETILIINKKDLPSGLDPSGRAFLNSLSGLRVVSISAQSGAGLDDLKTTMIQASGVVEHTPGEPSATITNSRHHDALVRSGARLEMALGSLEENRGGEFISLDLRAALDHLGEIIGVVTTDDILNSIFSRFCIGK